MSKSYSVSCDISANVIGQPLNFKILLDDVEVFSEYMTKPDYKFHHKSLSDDTSHSLKFILSEKTNDHTKVDKSGNFVDSAYVEIKNISFDNINITEILMSNETLTSYTHDKNGYSNEIIEKIYTPYMGYNGVVELKFNTPIYMWLLDIMD